MGTAIEALVQSIQSVGAQAFRTLALIDSAREEQTAAMLESLETKPQSSSSDRNFKNVKILNSLSHQFRLLEQDLKQAYALAESMRCPDGAAPAVEMRSLPAVHLARPASKNRGASFRGAKTDELLMNYLRSQAGNGSATPPLTLKVISKALGKPPTTLHASLKRLRDAGRVTTVGDGEYVLLT